jgi:CIC family chloride channel protein
VATAEHRSRPSGPLPVAPSMAEALTELRVPARAVTISPRVVFVTAIAIGVALIAGLVAQVLSRLIGLVTNLAFFGRFDASIVSPAGNQLGIFVMIPPLVGAFLVGLMARYGSRAIRGHGIPEAMEQVLLNQSRIPPRITFLKPLSAALAIGTGGPFGAEGPIIATGGALGSVVGQLLSTTADERKTLLSAGAAAGMAATFGSPVSAVLLAVELLLFEYRPRSVVPVALAAATAAGVRVAFAGSAPVFAMPEVPAPSFGALIFYVAVGAVMGVFAMLVTRAVYVIEDGFERLPIHWMWWPMLGALVVGIVGYFVPRTLGVGYDNIEAIISGQMIGTSLALLFVAKFVSWAVALGSGTSGGTLAPLFTIGAGLGSTLGALGLHFLPGVGIDVRIAALVGMAAIFAGASRALLASIVFAFETTRQPMGLLPLLAGCAAAFLVSALLMRNSIMTEKLARRGVPALSEYSVDHLSQVLVRDYGLREVVCLRVEQTLSEVRGWLSRHEPGSSHQGFPVLNAEGRLVGVVTRRDLLEPAHAPERRVGQILTRLPAVAFLDNSLREAADLMVRENVGRLPVVGRDEPRQIVGILTRSDLLRAHHKRLVGAEHAVQSLRLTSWFGRSSSAGVGS